MRLRLNSSTEDLHDGVFAVFVVTGYEYHHAFL